MRRTDGRSVGLGDEIMATGVARRLQARDPRKVEILDRRGRRRWHPLWAGNPRIARPGERGDFQRATDGPGCRPYIDYAAMRGESARRWPGAPFDLKRRAQPWRFRAGWRATPGEIHCVPRAGPGDYVLIEPHLKPGAMPGKDWGWERWQALVAARRDLEWLQIGRQGTRPLAGARFLETPSFRDALGVVSGARAAVLPEGALHHAAAARGVPAVVLFGGCADPAATGYGWHRNLTGGGPASPCGMRLPCDHCAAAMAEITVDRVAHELAEILG